MISPTHYLIISTALFFIGLAGMVINRNDLYKTLFSAQLIIIAITTNFVIFANLHNNITGQMFALFLLILAVAELTLGALLISNHFQINKSLNPDKVSHYE